MTVRSNGIDRCSSRKYDRCQVTIEPGRIRRASSAITALMVAPCSVAIQADQVVGPDRCRSP